MGVTSIHPIKNSAKGTGSLYSVLYITRDKIKDPSVEDIERYMRNGLDFEFEDEMICKTINSYVNCSADPYLANKEMENIRKMYHKDNDKIISYHLIQSVKEDPSKVNVEEFHRQGVELASNLFKGFQVIISTHVNTDNIHNHFIINAVNMCTGKKWNDCDKTKDLIRQMSDASLEKSGFKVLEETRKFQRYYHKDRDERTHLKTNDYRTTQSYDNHKKKIIPSRDIVRADIDLLIPFCKNYDELIERLVENRYSVRYKKPKGGYYKFTTFKPPFRPSGVRDYTLSEDGYYTRENLIKVINEQIEKKENSWMDWAKDFENDIEENTIRYSLKDNKYYRFKFDGKYLDEMNEKYKTLIKKDSDEPIYEFRSSDDAILVSDTKLYHSLLQEESKEYWNNHSFKRENDTGFENFVWKDKKLKYYFDRIQANAQALEFSDKENISSLKEVNANVQMLYVQRKNIESQFFSIKKVLAEFGDDIIILNQYKEVREQISVLSNLNRSEAQNIQLEKLKHLAETYLERLDIRGLKSTDKQDTLMTKYEEYKKRFSELIDTTKIVTNKLKEYDQYMNTMKYINKDIRTGNGAFNEELEIYDYIKEMNRTKKYTIPQRVDEKEKEMQREKDRGRTNKNKGR